MSHIVDSEIPESYKEKLRLISNHNVQMEENNEFKELNFVNAESLRFEVKIPDELIQDILLTNGLSVIYGDSNCGKTFFAIDMACAIARGTKWMNKNVEQGMIVYLASEGPNSVEMRLHAYQKYFNVPISNFFIVKTPINFYESKKITKYLIKFIRYLELKYGKKVKMIIGDTLASLSSGSNENSGQDMSIVINKINEIRNQCNTHFCLIHHSGKNVNAGARGWSGLRAAIDTEIEVTETASGKCAEITKLRDIGKKGERFGFRLVPTVIGINKWKQPVTSCVLESMDAPVSEKNKKYSDIANGIVGFLIGSKASVHKKIIAKNLSESMQKSTSSIYRELRKLIDNNIVVDNQGFINLVPISTD